MGGDLCPWGNQCRFNHEITDAQKNDETLQTNMANKLHHVQQQKVQKKADNVKIPQHVMQTMYRLLSDPSGANQEMLVNQNRDGEVDVPMHTIQKMYEMLNGGRLNHF